MLSVTDVQSRKSSSRRLGKAIRLFFFRLKKGTIDKYFFLNLFVRLFDFFVSCVKLSFHFPTFKSLGISVNNVSSKDSNFKSCSPFLIN